MIDKKLSFALPSPWKDKRFEAARIGPINFLVGPNGSGKSRFAEVLKDSLGNARALGTERLSGMEQSGGLRNLIGDHFPSGYPKDRFSQFKVAGSLGSGMDTIVLLEERLDLRIQVEATLSHLFNRKISLEWSSGILLAKAIIEGSGESYRLDRDECHGIKELLVLLTHLYNNEHPFLIIDEPELNLHPQYQAFFMQEVRRCAGNPAIDAKKKVVFLITHSPFILDFRTAEDVQAVISFSLDHAVPRQMQVMDSEATRRLTSLIPRLNVHHKQLFFSDNPIFVEGILDAQLIGAMQEARGVSVAGAGSCIVDAGGCEEVNRYVELCRAFDKEAHFLYDLDSLFNGNLRACVKDDGSVQSFLATAGVGSDFGQYCGALDSTLTKLIDQLLAPDGAVPTSLGRLVEYLSQLGVRTSWDKQKWAKARVAALTALDRYRDDVASVAGRELVSVVEGRLAKIVSALEEKNIHVLPGGTLERYLPHYTGDDYELLSDAKRDAVVAETEELARLITEEELSARYSSLFDAVRRLPAKMNVDVKSVLKMYLSRYIHELQQAVVRHPSWGLHEVRAHLAASLPSNERVFTIRSLERGESKEFTATIDVAELFSQKQGSVEVDQRTNAGMGDFKIDD